MFKCLMFDYYYLLFIIIIYYYYLLLFIIIIIYYTSMLKTSARGANLVCFLLFFRSILTGVFFLAVFFSLEELHPLLHRLSFVVCHFRPNDRNSVFFVSFCACRLAISTILFRAFAITSSGSLLEVPLNGTNFGVSSGNL